MSADSRGNNWYIQIAEDIWGAENTKFGKMLAWSKFLHLWGVKTNIVKKFVGKSLKHQKFSKWFVKRYPGQKETRWAETTNLLATGRTVCYIKVRGSTRKWVSPSDESTKMDCDFLGHSWRNKTSLLRRLQVQTLPDATPPLGKIHPSPKSR